MYTITSYTQHQAKKLGVRVTPSKNKKKKLDVYKNGKKIASVGDLGYGDYPTFLKSRGKIYADKRRRAYKRRHSKDRHTGNGFYADRLLW